MPSAQGLVRWFGFDTIVADNLADIRGVDGSAAVGRGDGEEAMARRQFEEEEHAYWSRLRESLIASHAGRWVAVVGGAVVAEGNALGKVAAEAYAATGSSVMYVAQVGHEDAPHRLLAGSTTTPASPAPSTGRSAPKEAGGGYKAKLSNRALYPVLELQTRSVVPLHTSNVSYLVDTGADISALTPGVAATLRVRLSPVGRMRITGWAGESSLRTLYLSVVVVAAKEVFAAVDAEADLCILGRDVLNEFRLVASPREHLLSLEVVEPTLPQGGEGQVSGITTTSTVGWWATEDQLTKASGPGDSGPGTRGSVSIAVALGAAVAGYGFWSSR